MHYEVRFGKSEHRPRRVGIHGCSISGDNTTTEADRDGEER